MYVCVGCCFLICPSRQEADKAVNACHNKKTLPGVSSNFSFLACSPHCIIDYFAHCGLKLVGNLAIVFFIH